MFNLFKIFSTTERIGVNVSATHPVEKLRHFLGKGDLLPLDKEDPLVLEGAGPVHVDLELAPDILGDHEQLGETLAKHLL